MEVLSLYDLSDAEILVRVAITITGDQTDATAIQTDERNKEVIFKNFAPFRECITDAKNLNLQIDNAKN